MGAAPNAGAGVLPNAADGVGAPPNKLVVGADPNAVEGAGADPNAGAGAGDAPKDVAGAGVEPNVVVEDEEPKPKDGAGAFVDEPKENPPPLEAGAGVEAAPKEKAIVKRTIQNLC